MPFYRISTEAWWSGQLRVEEEQLIGGGDLEDAERGQREFLALDKKGNGGKGPVLGVDLHQFTGDRS